MNITIATVNHPSSSYTADTTNQDGVGFTTVAWNVVVGSSRNKMQLISEDVKYILDIVFPISTFIVTSLFGIVVNTINIIVYRKQGLQDSITFGFFALSISDLVVVMCPLAMSCCYIAKFMLPDAPINFMAFHYVSTGRLRRMAYSFSNVLTAFLSIERCCCVMLPFKVKALFTWRRTLRIILSILLVHILCYAPLFATNQLRWIQDPKRNNTETLRAWFAPHHQEIEAFNFTLMSIVTPTVSQIVVVCSTAILINGLRSSSKFRKMTTGTGNEKEESSSGLSGRDARLAKAMVFLGGILSACNVPYLCLTYAILLEPELDMGKAYHNTYSVTSAITFILASTNASVNIFVYYNTSSRYREVFTETFRSQKK